MFVIKRFAVDAIASNPKTSVTKKWRFPRQNRAASSYAETNVFFSSAENGTVCFRG
jgi:hypothetical protein